MIAALKIVIIFLFVSTALGLAFYAVRIGLRRDTQPDPFSRPFGEMPGFSAEQLRAIAGRLPRHDPLRRSFANQPIPPIVDNERNNARYEAQMLFWRPSKQSSGPALRPVDAGGRVIHPLVTVARNFFERKRHVRVS